MNSGCKTVLKPTQCDEKNRNTLHWKASSALRPQGKCASVRGGKKTPRWRMPLLQRRTESIRASASHSNGNGQQPRWHHECPSGCMEARQQRTTKARKRACVRMWQQVRVTPPAAWAARTPGTRPLGPKGYKTGPKRSCSKSTAAEGGPRPSGSCPRASAS